MRNQTPQPNKSPEPTAVGAVSSLSRFTPRVGGGSAFYVRPKPYARPGVQNHIMKKHIALGLVASTLFLAGCCTGHHAVVWQYQTVGSLDMANKWAADGWVVAGYTMYVDTGSITREGFLLKRPKQ